MQSLKDKLVFITGGAGGIGAGLGRAFGGYGARVVLADLDKERLSEQVRRLADAGVQAEAVELDVTAPEAWQACVALMDQRGGIDVLCNNAGIGASGTNADFDISVWRKVMEVNVFGAFYGCRFALPGMLARNVEGHIVNTASLSGMIPSGGSPYVASKHAVVGLSGDLRAELKGGKIGVSVLCPAMVRTQFVANSARVLGGDLHEAMAAALQTGIDPDKVGDLVARAVLEGRYYIMTHPEWKPIVAAHFDEILGAFAEGADPEHVEDFDALAAALKRGD